MEKHVLIRHFDNISQLKLINNGRSTRKGKSHEDGFRRNLQLYMAVIMLRFCHFFCDLRTFCEKKVPQFIMSKLAQLAKWASQRLWLFFLEKHHKMVKHGKLKKLEYLILSPEKILTKDSVTVAVDAVMYYRVANPMSAVCNVSNYRTSTSLLAQTTLRNCLGTKELSQILSDREHIANTMQSVIDMATDPWGIKVERIEIKDVRLPMQLQRAMAAEAEAAREARAKVIAAEGEQKASRALKEAADIISESPAALQLRYLQTLGTVAAEKNSTIIFPLPIDMISHMSGMNTKSVSAL
ncbi:unnamed protein product, partial [Meganyctiphanes norvegica]